MMGAQIEVRALLNVPLIRTPTDIGQFVLDALGANDLAPEQDDIVVIAQKLVSKAEGRTVRLSGVVPSPKATELGRRTGKDPRLVELILAESNEVVVCQGGHLIMEHKLGFVCANAGVDQSNTGYSDGHAVLLPLDPDGSAEAIRQAVEAAYGVKVGVIVNDSHGRAFRNGAIGIAVGVAGLAPLQSWVGESDLDGHPLTSTQEAVADEVASAASILMGQGAEGRPIVVVRGLRILGTGHSAGALIRPKESDLFRR